MDFFEAVQERYSYRDEFIDKEIPEDTLRKIVQAGLDAPSGKNMQTTEFIVVDDESVISQIGSMHTIKAMQQAKALIVCLIDKEPQAVYEGYSFQIEDCSAAVENILLAATACGLSSVWIDGWLRVENHAEKIAGILNIPDKKQIRVILPLGFAANKGPRREKKSFDQRVWFNSYDK